MSEPKPIHDDIDLSRAWQVGRRIYVRCGYESTLGVQLREQLGANWDRTERRLWVGSGKKDRVLPLILAADERVRGVEEVKRQGRWVRIPFEASDIRGRAKDLGAVWDGDSKLWALPTDEALAEIQRLVAERQRREDEAKAAAREEAKRRDAEQARLDHEADRRDAERTRDRLIAEAGRTATGDTAQLRIVSTRRMNKATAWAAAYQPGAVVRLDDGRRGVVVSAQVWFTGEEMASSTCWHPETHDTAHWDLLHTVAIVEPTPQEQAGDDAQRAERADAAEIHQITEAALHAGDLTEGWSTIDATQRAGIIRCWYGSTHHSSGTLTLTTDGRVIRQHPGYYDDYVRTTRTSTDPTLVERVRALLDRGARRRRYADQTQYEYEVVIGDPS